MSSQPSPAAPYEFTLQQKLYVWLTGAFVACLLVADVIGVRLFRIPFPFGLELPLPWAGTPITAVEHTCGMLTFPVTFLLTDLINEYYGKRGARRVTWIGLAMGAFTFLILNLALVMPRLDAPYNVDEPAFVAVFGSSRMMFVASLCAFVVGQLSDIAIFGFLKRLTRGRMIWLRATGSTVISQAIDSFFVSWIAFSLGRHLVPDSGVPAPFIDVLKIAATGYLLKFTLAVAITPLIYAGHGILHRWFGLVPVPADAR
ncbi:MAG: queuosine precursor transporter [Phycisphaerales bacterium]